MNTNIENSIVATDNSKISNAKIRLNQDSNNNEFAKDAITQNSIVAKQGGQITQASINIIKEKRKSFWCGFVVGIFSSVIGCAIWYLIEIFIIN
jgi:hypothetical protein